MNGVAVMLNAPIASFLYPTAEGLAGCRDYAGVWGSATDRSEAVKCRGKRDKRVRGVGQWRTLRQAPRNLSAVAFCGLGRVVGAG